MAVPNIFANVTTSIPLSQLDTNFATAVVLGNTSVYLGNTTTTLGNVTLANANVTTALTIAGASGTSGQVLTSGGANAAPTWTTVSASQWTTTGSNIYYSTGNVGIGSAPSAWSGFTALDIGSQSSLWSIGSGNGTSYYSNNLYYNGSARIYKTTGGASEYTQSSGSHQFYIAASGTAGNSVSLSERGRFNSNGFFQATNNDYPDGGGTGSYHYFNSNLSSGQVVLIRADNTSFTDYVLFIRGNRNTTNGSFYLLSAENGNSTGIFRVRDSGNCVNTNNSYGAVSDVSLKENIVDSTPKLANLMQVKIRNYNLKAKPDEKQIGVVAQELETVFPSMVEEDKDGVKSVKYSVFVPMLIKAMQEQQELITTQAETITALTARIVALESK
jgi:hypothetical protein